MSVLDDTPDPAVRRIRSANDIPRRPPRAYTGTPSPLSPLTPREGRVTSIHGLADTPPSPSSPADRRIEQPLGVPDTPTAREPSVRSHTATASARNRPESDQPQHNSSFYVRVLSYLGLGRTASHARKSFVSLVWNMAWGFTQVVVIVTMLILTGTYFRSAVNPAHSEWKACDRPLGFWASMWVVRVILASGLAFWEYKRDQARRNRRQGEVESGDGNGSGAIPTAPPIPSRYNTDLPPSRRPGLPVDQGDNSVPSVVLPYTVLYSRLTLLSSLVTLSWFLTAHILEYTSVNTCRETSPHLWWLVFGILCIMYLMVLEVVLLGFVVLIVAPILFIFWNIILICVGRHPLQTQQTIKPEIGKLPKSVVDRIPLVIYIPPPPEEEENATSTAESYEYPPKPLQSSKPPQRRFKFLRTIPTFGPNDKKKSKKPDEKAETENTSAPSSSTWEETWEQGEYPFVRIEGNRAHCVICISDFEEPNRKGAATKEKEVSKTPGVQNKAPPNSSNPSAEPRQNVEEQRQEELRLTEPGEGSQPLRLLPCRHAFHQTCLDQWLINVSGRCPTCQAPVTLPKKSKSNRRLI